MDVPSKEEVSFPYAGAEVEVACASPREPW